jgi:hypothetical protein
MMKFINFMTAHFIGKRTEAAAVLAAILSAAGFLAEQFGWNVSPEDLQKLAEALLAIALVFLGDRITRKG